MASGNKHPLAVPVDLLCIHCKGHLTVEKDTGNSLQNTQNNSTSQELENLHEDMLEFDVYGSVHPGNISSVLFFKLGVLYFFFICSTCFGTTPSSGAQLYCSSQRCVDSFWFCLFHMSRYWLGHPRTLECS